MVSEIEEIRRQALEAIASAADLQALDEVRVRFTGRRSRLRQLLGGIGQLAADQRPAAGQAAGQAQKQIAAALDERQQALERAAESAAAIDLTLPGRPQRRGSTHPLSATADELVDALRQMGFRVADGPEVEDERHNFDALNTPADHPARDEQDTFYLTDGRLLRTHTSTVQIRVMERQPPPVRVLSVGPLLPPRERRRHPPRGLPPDRGALRRRGGLHGRPQGHPHRPRPAGPRRGDEDPFPAPLLPLHRAQCRVRLLLYPLRPGRLRRPGALPHLQGHRLDRDRRGRHGRPRGLRRRRLRCGEVTRASPSGSESNGWP